MPKTCPTLNNWLNSDNCMENLAGLGSDLYVFIKNELTAPLTIKASTENEYTTPSFKSGKCLYKIQCKDESVQHKDTSLGKRKGFKQELDFIVDADNSDSVKINRALNNHEVGFIYIDNGVSYIVYDPVYNGKFDNDGISGDTGAAASDDRQTSYTYVLQPTTYGKYLVTPPEGGWDSLLEPVAGA